jgi:hypothetical protein
MTPRILSRRTLATATIAVAVSLGSVAGVSLAQGNDPTPAVSTPSAPTASPGGILAGVHLVLARLVADGTIDQRQEDAVQAQADAGSIDPKQLVQGGVVTDSQMQAIAAKIDQVKFDNGG